MRNVWESCSWFNNERLFGFYSLQSTLHVPCLIELLNNAAIFPRGDATEIQTMQGNSTRSGGLLVLLPHWTILRAMLQDRNFPDKGTERQRGSFSFEGNLVLQAHLPIFWLCCLSFVTSQTLDRGEVK